MTNCIWKVALYTTEELTVHFTFIPSACKLESKIQHHIWQAMFLFFVEFPGKSLQKADPSCEVFTCKFGYGNLPTQKGRRRSLSNLSVFVLWLKVQPSKCSIQERSMYFRTNRVFIKTWHFLYSVMMSALTKTMMILVNIPHT